MPKTGKKRTQTVAISEFKAKCLSLIDQVNKTKMPLRITKRGEPIADVIPAIVQAGEKHWIGSMTHRMDIIGDIVSPVIDTAEIEALKD